MARRLWASAALLLALATPVHARADNPLNSNEKAVADASAELDGGGSTDFTIVPVAGGSTDIGVGAGAFAGVTRNQGQDAPFLWHVETAGFVSGAVKDGSFEIPYADIYAKLTLTHFLGGPFQLEVRPSFTTERALYFYGMGNASSATPPPGQGSTYFQYTRTHPELLSDLRYKLLDHLAGRVGLRYIETLYDVPSNSALANAVRSASPEVRKLIGPLSTQGEALIRAGIQYDTRDNEVSPHQGTFDELDLNWSPGGTPALPFDYGEAGLVLRAFHPLFSPRFTLAGRLVGDILVGNPPLFELSRAVDQFAIGGSNGVRGVPAERYYGKVKVFGNAEVRAKLFDFWLVGKGFTLGSAAFFDAGRLWADTTKQPALDGTGLGLKYGTGVGLRLMSGTAFVLRADVAWSPDATPIGGYVIAGEAF